MFRLLKNEKGSWGMVAVAAIGTTAAVVGSGAFVDSPESPNRPEYQEDEDYRETQDYLKDFGMGLLEGDVPDYYKSIGETGSEQFEDFMGMAKRDVMQSTTEALAKGGRARGGQLAASTAGKIGDMSTDMRFKDYLRASEGKQWLMGTGLEVTEGVRGAGQTEGGNVNRFNQQDYRFEVDERNYRYKAALNKAAATGEAIGAVGDFAGELGGIYDYKKYTKNNSSYVEPTAKENSANQSLMYRY